jgi:glycine cleavage system aminomethyltransferase T
VFEDVGQWKRPWFYPREGRGWTRPSPASVAPRDGVAVMDASTLGKIDVQGPDAVEFLNRMYTGDFCKLGVGRCKYGLLCHADGMVFDDGVTMRVGPDRFLVTTTTGNAAAVLEWFEEWLQTEWPAAAGALHVGHGAVGDGGGRRPALARRDRRPRTTGSTWATRRSRSWPSVRREVAGWPRASAG